MLIKWENFGAFLSWFVRWENILTGDVLNKFYCITLCTKAQIVLIYLVVHWDMPFLHTSAKYTFILCFLSFCVGSEHVTVGGIAPFLQVKLNKKYVSDIWDTDRCLIWRICQHLKNVEVKGLNA
jgi:hypothetical protein